MAVAKYRVTNKSSNGNTFSINAVGTFQAQSKSALVHTVATLALKASGALYSGARILNFHTFASDASEAFSAVNESAFVS